MHVNLSELKRDYQEGRVVPFIGAGLSVPFNVPTWKLLIESITKKYAVGKKSFIKDVVETHLKSNDYWGAIGALKHYAILNDKVIQTEIVKLIKEKQVSLKNNNLHNYLDIANMEFELYLTTNYENLLHEYVNCDNVPILLKDIDFSTQEMFDEKRILHLHGYTSNPGSIVISRESYMNLYNDNKYKKLLSIITGSKKLLFMGFSFDDQFVSTLLKDHKKYFNGEHYIVLNNPTDEKIRELRNEYGLITIDYQAEDSSHTEEIRKILNHIADNKGHDNHKNSDAIVETLAPIVLEEEVVEQNISCERIFSDDFKNMLHNEAPSGYSLKEYKAVHLTGLSYPEAYALYRPETAREFEPATNIITVYQYNIDEDQWKVIFKEYIDDVRMYADNPIDLTQDKREQLIIKTQQGSGAYLSVMILGSKDNKSVSVLLGSAAGTCFSLFQGSYKIIKEKYLTFYESDRVIASYKWSDLGLEKVSTFMTQQLSAIPVLIDLDNSNSITINYRINEKRHIEANVQNHQTVIGKVGNKISLIREDATTSSVNTRIFCSSKKEDSYNSETGEILAPDIITIKIIPEGYNWDNLFVIYINAIDNTAVNGEGSKFGSIIH
ncbi:SIR2 family NAD-dependent protein deacylase [Priestia aryabhattai]|uniref:SIR2 family NAD-dependent protein deacylase n=1 Tax=Priestia aryabhattai TaxID=412384 RepID=UPI003CF84655